MPTTTSTTSLATSLVSIAVAACIVPPVRVSGGGGGAAGAVHIRDSRETLRSRASGQVGQLRIAFTPLTLADERRRSVDVSLGFTLERMRLEPDGPGDRTGLFAEVAWFARQSRGAAEHWRLGPTLLVEGTNTVEAVDAPGYGAALGLLVELVDPVRMGSPVAQFRGDLGLGAALRAGVRHDDGGTYGTLVLSLELRLPGGVGIPIPEPRPR